MNNDEFAGMLKNLDPQRREETIRKLYAKM